MFLTGLYRVAWRARVMRSVLCGLGQQERPRPRSAGRVRRGAGGAGRRGRVLVLCRVQNRPRRVRLAEVGEDLRIRARPTRGGGGTDGSEVLWEGAPGLRRYAADRRDRTPLFGTDRARLAPKLCSSAGGVRQEGGLYALPCTAASSSRSNEVSAKGRQYAHLAVDEEPVLAGTTLKWRKGRRCHERHEVPAITETADLPLCFAVAHLERLESDRRVVRAGIHNAELRACLGALTSRTCA